MILGYKKNRAFSTNEVMIALTIVGIIAAILIPVIINSKPSNNKIMFRKAYSTLERAVQEMIDDETHYPESAVITLDDGITYKKGFNYTAATTNGTNNKFTYLLSEKLNTVGLVDLPTVSEGGPGTFAKFTTADGINWAIYIRRSDQDTDAETPETADNAGAVQFPICTNDTTNCYTLQVTVDVNGSNPPNCAENEMDADRHIPACESNIFPDTFRIDIRHDGKLYIDPTYYSKAIDILKSPLDNSK